MTNTESQGAGEWEYLQDGARIVRRKLDEKLGRKLVVASLRPRDAVDLLNQQARELYSLREALSVTAKLASRLDSMLTWFHVEPNGIGLDSPAHQTLEERLACPVCQPYADALAEYHALTSPEEVNQ